jgi:hypothetical protein
MPCTALWKSSSASLYITNISPKRKNTWHTQCPLSDHGYASYYHCNSRNRSHKGWLVEEETRWPKHLVRAPRQGISSGHLVKASRQGISSRHLVKVPRQSFSLKKPRTVSKSGGQDLRHENSSDHMRRGQVNGYLERVRERGLCSIHLALMGYALIVDVNP